MTTLLRLAVVLTTSLAALSGTVAVAAAAPAPRPTAQAQQALCIARKSIELLTAINRLPSRDPRARVAAVRAIPAQARAACPLGGTTPPPPVVPPATMAQVGAVTPGPAEVIVEVPVTAGARELKSDEFAPCDPRTPIRVGVATPPPAGVTAHAAVPGDYVTVQVRNTTDAPVTVVFRVVCGGRGTGLPAGNANDDPTMPPSVAPAQVGFSPKADSEVGPWQYDAGRQRWHFTVTYRIPQTGPTTAADNLLFTCPDGYRVDRAGATYDPDSVYSQGAQVPGSSHGEVDANGLPQTWQIIWRFPTAPADLDYTLVAYLGCALDPPGPAGF
jgi:hypothetical protein